MAILAGLPGPPNMEVGPMGILAGIAAGMAGAAGLAAGLPAAWLSILAGPRPNCRLIVVSHIPTARVVIDGFTFLVDKLVPVSFF